MSEYGHEANLAVSQFQHVAQLRRATEKGCFHAHGLFHLSLVSKLFLQEVRPLLCYRPWSRLRFLVWQTHKSGTSTSYHIADVGALDKQATCERTRPFNILRSPCIRNVGCVDLFLQIAELLHIVGM